MPTELLTIGPLHALVQNLAYAMPARQTLGYTSDTGATLQAADEITFASAETITIAADGSFSTRAPFIRTTSADVEIRLQAV